MNRPSKKRTGETTTSAFSPSSERLIRGTCSGARSVWEVRTGDKTATCFAVLMRQMAKQVHLSVRHHIFQSCWLLFAWFFGR